MTSLKSEKFLIPAPHCNFCIVHWVVLDDDDDKNVSDFDDDDDGENANGPPGS